MKEYVKLSVDAVAYYSGNTYYEEVFLPLDVWNEIKDGFDMSLYLCEFDGKHSEVEVDIDVVIMTEERLKTYIPVQSNDGETLFYHIYEHLDVNEYDDSYLLNIQEEVAALCQVETMTIKFNVNNKETILSLLQGYIL